MQPPEVRAGTARGFDRRPRSRIFTTASAVVSLAQGRASVGRWPGRTSRIAAMLKLGSSGPDVATLQARLVALGFDASGTFGAATDAAVRAFQAAHGLLPDGIVGPATKRVLDAGPALPRQPDGPAPLRVDTSLRLPAGEYVQDVFPKDLVVLHHTVGRTAQSTVHGWATDSLGRVATAYVVERDGTIFEVFDPRRWAFHLGVRGQTGLERRSIGIEMASEGGLKKHTDGKLYAFDRVVPSTRFDGPIYEHPSTWRGFRYFAAYTPAQVQSVCSLVHHLTETFGIPRRTPADHRGSSRVAFSYKGIIGHHHVRPDKSDVHPGFDWDALIQTCGLTTA